MAQHGHRFLAAEPLEQQGAIGRRLPLDALRRVSRQHVADDGRRRRHVDGIRARRSLRSTGIDSSRRAALSGCRREIGGDELLAAAHGVFLILMNGSALKFWPGTETSPTSVSMNTQPSAISTMRPSKRADLHVVARRVVLARVVRADEVREVLARAEREDERDAAEHGRGRHRRELDEEVDVDAELVDADDDAADDDDGLREPAEQAALADAEADGRLLEDMARERAAREADDDDDDAADRRRQVREQVLGPALEQRAAQDPQARWRRRPAARSRTRPWRSRGSWPA